MKNLFAIIVAVGILVSRSSMAQQTGQDRAAAAQSRIHNRFSKVDSNKDGKITLAELQAGSIKMSPERWKIRAERFAAFDRNHDGGVTMEEVAETRRLRFEARKAN